MQIGLQDWIIEKNIKTEIAKAKMNTMKAKFNKPTMTICTIQQAKTKKKKI